MKTERPHELKKPTRENETKALRQENTGKRTGYEKETGYGKKSTVGIMPAGHYSHPSGLFPSPWYS